MAPAPDKGKKIVDAALEEKDFDLRNLVGQELFEAEKKELQEYGISCGYQSRAMLFGGIDEGGLRMHSRVHQGKDNRHSIEECRFPEARSWY